MAVTGPASVHSPLTGLIEVRVGERVLKKFRSMEKAVSYAMGYNAGWQARTHIEVE